jgi:hypothetical protein
LAQGVYAVMVMVFLVHVACQWNRLQLKYAAVILT